MVTWPLGAYIAYMTQVMIVTLYTHETISSTASSSSFIVDSMAEF